MFHTCRERGLATVAVYSEADRDAPHRFAADDSVEIGPAPPSLSYLNIEAILEAAARTSADAVHPGYGFLSENADFAAAVEAAGLTFIGPTPENMSCMGDKVRARELMQSAGVPVVPGSDATVDDAAELARAAESVGYPLLVKAVGGGGGKGIRRVDSPEELENAWQRAISEASSAFGDARVYIERLVENARHVEAQVLGDGQGAAIFLGERECSLQRHHQKLVEETPSPVIDDEVRAALREAALSGTRAINYRGAGTIEFLYDEARREFYFLEMNTRLQVEHPVTEMVIRRDLVAEQLRIAEGAELSGETDPLSRGHAIEFRVTAEDPFRGFIPSTGRIEALRLPHGPFTRIDAALRDGYEIPPHYDSLIAKLIAWGETRDEAICRMRTLLSRTRIGGIHTTIPLGIRICGWDAFRRGDFHTSSLETWLAESALPSAPPPLAARLASIVVREGIKSRTTPATSNGHLPHEVSNWARTARLEGIRREE